MEDGKPRLMLACSLGRLSPVLLGWLHVTSWLVRLVAVNLTSGIVIRYHIMDKAGINSYCVASVMSDHQVNR